MPESVEVYNQIQNSQYSYQNLGKLWRIIPGKLNRYKKIQNLRT
jgi:hypothetical protein